MMGISRGWAVAGLVALTSASLISGSWVSTSDEQRSSGHRRFTLVERLSDPYQQVIDVGAAGTSAGDQLVAERPLFEATTGQQVGTLVVDVTYIRVFPNRDVLIAFNANNVLRDGSFVTQGSFRFSERETTFAIVGGTGAFARARGTVTRQVLADNNTVRFSVDVRP